MAVHLSFCHMDPWFTPGHSIPKGVRREVLWVELPKMAGPWKRLPYDMSQPCLVNASFCMGVIIERIKATMCFLKWVRWLRKPLSRFLEAGPSHWHTHYSLLQGTVPPGSSCKVCLEKFSLSSTGFSGSPLWPFALFWVLCFPFRKEQHYRNLFFPIAC